MIEFKREGYVGRTGDGTKVYVEIEVSTQQGEHQTTEHDTVTSVPRISVSGHYYVPRSPGGRIGPRADWDGGGQCLDTLAEVTEPASGLTLQDIGRLVYVWRHWHLNDCRAGCAHQTPVWRDNPRYGYREIDLDNTPACPHTGYRFGSAWLVDVPPIEVTDELRTLAGKLDGTDGLRH